MIVARAIREYELKLPPKSSCKFKPDRPGRVVRRRLYPTRSEPLGCRGSRRRTSIVGLVAIRSGAEPVAAVAGRAFARAGVPPWTPRNFRPDEGGPCWPIARVPPTIIVLCEYPGVDMPKAVWESRRSLAGSE